MPPAAGCIDVGKHDNRVFANITRPVRVDVNYDSWLGKVPGSKTKKNSWADDPRVFKGWQQVR